MRLYDRRSFALSSLALAGCAAALQSPPANFRGTLDALAAIDPQARWDVLQTIRQPLLTPQERLLFEAVIRGAEADAVLWRIPYGAAPNPYAVSQRNGAYRSAASDAAAIASETERLNADAELGVIAPDFVLTATIPLVEAAATQASGARAEALRTQAQTLRALLARASNEPSVARLPHGETFYRAALQFHLGGAVDPPAAHAEARARCEALHVQADALLRSQGFRDGDVAARLRALLADPRQLYPATEAGRETALKDMRAALARAPDLFASDFSEALPEAEIRALPASDEANGTRGRREGNAYIVDLGGPRARWTMASVVYHETVPGHLLQAPFEAAANAPALQRRYAGGYSEGWATYAESLANARGGFADDPLSQLGYLHWMLFRLGRVVVDTGMHAFGWSRARAMEEVRALQGGPIAFVGIEEDVDRIAAQPGVAAAQGLAAMHFEHLLARTRAFRNFSMRRFHDAMLRHGPLSPPGLDQAIAIALG